MKYDVGYADGLFGKKTRGAIRAWQEVKGFEGTGYLTAEQAEALKAVGERVRGEEAKRAAAERERVAREEAELEREKAEEAERKARAAVEREGKRPGREFRDCVPSVRRWWWCRRGSS